MARLRCEHPEGVTESSGRKIQTPDPEEVDLAHNSQNLKKLHRQLPGDYISDTFNDNVNGKSPLKVKNASQGASPGKQIRLTPLNLLKTSRTLGFQSPSDWEPCRRPKSLRTSPLKGHAANEIPNPILDDRKNEEPVAIPEDESSWCDSGSSGNESEDSEGDLPSPWKLLSLEPSTALNSNTTLSIDASHLPKVVESLSMQEAPIISTPQIEFDEPIDHHSLNPSEGESPSAIIQFIPPRLKNRPHRRPSYDRPATPPRSPTKSRLQSPSKSRSKVPTPPLRQSLDSFWNPNTINDWNDQYSPPKILQSPKKSKHVEDGTTDPSSLSPRKTGSPTKRTKAELNARKDFIAQRQCIAEAFFTELDDVVTDGQIRQLAQATGGVRLIWSKTLNSTAGRATWKRETTSVRQLDGSVTKIHKHHASIELAEKVIDDESRLLNVIAHEFCHLCNFMISGIKNQPHGAQFKAWGRKCTLAFGSRGIKVTTKHNYEIDYKYVWQCSNDDCGTEFRRHSKSIDPKAHTCGRCRGALIQIKPVPRETTAGAGTVYSKFVKDNFAITKQSMPGASQKEVMAAISRKYWSEKSKIATYTPESLADGTCPKMPERRPAIDLDEVTSALEVVTLE